MEPILVPNPSRFTTFPIKYPDLWKLYKKAIASFWTTEEVDLSADMNDWNKMSDQERYFIKHVLAFFAGSDGIVMENLNLNFASEVQISEARSFYSYQEFNESIHGETYSLLIDTYVDDHDEKTKLFKAIETIPCIQKKAEWAMNWFNKDQPFVERLVAFACVEGIFFSGAFCAIYWLKKRGLMPGLCFSNELISRDEGLHCDFAVALYHHLEQKPTESRIRNIVRSAVHIETEFICDALPCRLIGMNSDSMTTYIQFVADRLLKQFGVEPIWNSKNPFDFMEMISLEGKTSFFEKRVSEYSKMGVGNESGNSISFEDDFLKISLAIERRCGTGKGVWLSSATFRTSSPCSNEKQRIALQRYSSPFSFGFFEGLSSIRLASRYCLNAVRSSILKLLCVLLLIRMLLYILGLAILALLAIVLNDPIDPKEFARFYAPTKTVIYAPPLITGPPNHTEAYLNNEKTDILPGRRVNHTNGHTIIEGVHQISVPMRKVSGYVDPSDPPPLQGIKLSKSNGYTIIEGTPEITVPPSETRGLSLG